MKAAIKQSIFILLASAALLLALCLSLVSPNQNPLSPLMFIGGLIFMVILAIQSLAMLIVSIALQYLPQQDEESN